LAQFELTLINLKQFKLGYRVGGTSVAYRNCCSFLCSICKRNRIKI